VPLTDVLPPNLTELTITDRTSLPSNVARLDWELGRGHCCHLALFA
jgi:hypothetical protein